MMKECDCMMNEWMKLWMPQWSRHHCRIYTVAKMKEEFDLVMAENPNEPPS
jgi:hypothetical protein